jgi:hypothetical protein
VSVEAELNCSTRALARASLSGFSFAGRHESAHSQAQAASAGVKDSFRK